MPAVANSNGDGRKEAGSADEEYCCIREMRMGEGPKGKRNPRDSRKEVLTTLEAKQPVLGDLSV